MAAAPAANRRATQAGDREFELLCQAARPRPGIRQIAGILQEKIDHRLLLALAEQHGVRLCLFRVLDALAWCGVPYDIKSSLQQFKERHLAHCLAFANELHRLGGLFGKADIPFISFKGPTLSLLLQGDLAEREYNDLDILVPRARLADAEGVLEAAGYRNLQGGHDFRRAFLFQQRQYRFDCEQRNIAVDLHWDLIGNGLPFPVGVDEIWRRPGRIGLGGVEFPVPDRGELARVLAGHGTKEGWQCLKWVRDFALLIEKSHDLDWGDIHLRAERRRSGDAVLLACAMARELLAVEPPAALAPAVLRNQRVQAIAKSLCRRLQHARSDAESQESSFSDLLLCQHPIDRARFFARLAFQPTAGDHSALRLPRPLWPLYYATRPFRVGARALGSVGLHRSPRDHDPDRLP